jgi:hypothetical protein
VRIACANGMFCLIAAGRVSLAPPKYSRKTRRLSRADAGATGLGGVNPDLRHIPRAAVRYHLMRPSPDMKRTWHPYAFADAIVTLRSHVSEFQHELNNCCK